MKKLTIICAVFLFVCCGGVNMQTIDVEKFEQQLYATEAEQLIDVRTPQEFAKYHIQSAKNIDFKNPNFKKEIEKLDKTKPVLIYCLSGGRSKEALSVFREAGFTTVYELDGGINAWSKLGKPLVEDLSGKGELSVLEYDTAVSEESYVLVDFYAPWCAPCRKMLPMVEELAKTYNDHFKLLTIDFDQNRLLSKEKNISAVPYLIIFKNGEKIWEKQGEATKEELLKMLEIE